MEHRQIKNCAALTDVQINLSRMDYVDDTGPRQNYAAWRDVTNRWSNKAFVINMDQEFMIVYLPQNEEDSVNGI